MNEQEPPIGVMEGVHRHFHTRYGKRDDKAHVTTYTRDAPLVIGDTVVSRAEVGDETLLVAWAAVENEQGPLLAVTGLARWIPASAGDGESVAIVSVEDARQGVPALAAVGLVCGIEGWQVSWAGLIDDPTMPPARLRVVVLSEMSAVKAATLVGPITSLLEAGYGRRYWLPRQRLLALPETSFTCAGSAVCCSHELTIGIDENSRRLIEAIDWAAISPEVGEGPFTEELPAAAASLVTFRHRLTRQPGGRCHLLTADNRCSLHALAGRAVFKPCHVFPYKFAWCPDGFCVTTHAMCPTARFAKGAPLASQEADLRGRLAVADVLRTDAFYLRPGQAVPWEVFWVIEGQLLELLKGSAPMKQKLWVALLWLTRRLDDVQAGVDPAWYDQPIKRLGVVQRMVFRRFGELFDPCFKGLDGVEPGEGILPEHEEELTRWFRSLLFSKVTTYPYGLVAGFNYLVLIHHVLERQVEIHARKGISESFWREFYAVVTSGTFPRILQVCHQNPITYFARYAGTTDFGLNLLRL